MVNKLSDTVTELANAVFRVGGEASHGVGTVLGNLAHKLKNVDFDGVIQDVVGKGSNALNGLGNGLES